MNRSMPTIGASYTVQSGDTISELAFIVYGDARRYLELAEHNKDVPGFVAARLLPGLEIEIPEPDYLPMPSGIGGMRGSAGRTFSMNGDDRLRVVPVSTRREESHEQD
jgi:hypothetical protein